MTTLAYIIGSLVLIAIGIRLGWKDGYRYGYADGYCQGQYEEQATTSQKRSIITVNEHQLN